MLSGSPPFESEKKLKLVSIIIFVFFVSSVFIVIILFSPNLFLDLILHYKYRFMKNVTIVKQDSSMKLISGFFSCYNIPMHILYNERQNAPHNESFSPSAGKPKLFIDRIKAKYPVTIHSDWQPLERSDFYLAHDPAYVDTILDGQKANGFGNTSPALAQTLYYTNASFYHASSYALQHQCITLSPSSGFHHASYSSCFGYCTFNGLIITAIKLYQEYSLKKIGIIDFDAHYGNGTDNIIEHLGLNYIHHQGIKQLLDQHQKFQLSTLEKLLLQFKDCDYLLYQAGADPHIDDPLGGYLSTEELRIRDEKVFTFSQEHHIPLTWNLAGGYQQPIEKVLDLHENTVKEWLRAESNQKGNKKRQQ